MNSSLFQIPPSHFYLLCTKSNYVLNLLQNLAHKTGENSMENLKEFLENMLGILKKFSLRITPGIYEDFLQISDQNLTRSQAKSCTMCTSDIFNLPIWEFEK